MTERRKQSPETIAKRAEAIRRAWAESPPEKRAARVAAATAAARAKFDADPAARDARSERSSAWMTRLHQDPFFQARRDQRSRATMARLRADPAFQALMVEVAQGRYAKGLGIASADSRAAKTTATKWIMQQCHVEMIAQTDYAETYKRVQARLRMERPYDGPQSNSEYQEYLQQLGRAVVSDPELSAIQNDFMKTAIPRWSAAWKERRAGPKAEAD